MIILVGSQKGGCGKSTTAVNLCVALVRQGKDVILVDADRQSTASVWAAERAENTSLPPVHCIQKYDGIRDTLLDLDRRYEYVVVDVAGHDSRELRTGMTAAHLLVVPTRPSQPDLDTLPKLHEIIAQALDFNPALVARVLFTMAPTNPQIRELEQSQEYVRALVNMDVMATVIQDRKVYRDCMGEGRGVIEMDGQKAHDEIESLANEVLTYGKTKNSR